MNTNTNQPATHYVYIRVRESNEKNAELLTIAACVILGTLTSGGKRNVIAVDDERNRAFEIVGDVFVCDPETVHPLRRMRDR